MSDVVEAKPRRKRGTSPTARTLALLRKRGWTAAVVEKRVPFRKISIDLFGCIDVVAVNGAELMGVLGVQATSGTNAAARRKKAVAEPRLLAWLHAGNRFEVWGWRKLGARGKAKRWAVAVSSVTIADLDLSVEVLERLDRERRLRLGTLADVTIIEED